MLGFRRPSVLVVVALACVAAGLTGCSKQGKVVGPPGPTPAEWTRTTGGPGGAIVALAASDSFLFATTATAGVYRSSDSGATWTHANLVSPLGTDASYTTVYSLVSLGARLYAGVYGGVFRSSDNGRTWTFGLVEPTITRNNVLALAANGTSLFAGSAGTVYRSDNSGVDWSPLTQGVTVTDIRALAGGGQWLYAGAVAGGEDVDRSSDNGDTWAAAGPGGPIRSLLVVVGTVYAGGFSLNRSRDHGDTWTPLGGGLTGYDFRAIVVVDGSLFAGGVLGGVYRSDDGGDTWTATGLSTESITSLVVSGGSVYAGTEAGDLWRLPVARTAVTPTALLERDADLTQPAR